jgi:hypothetical protein
MPIQVQTSLMAGGLDLVTPPVAMPPGKAIAAVNYEPDVAGYTSFGGYERFDGSARPSDTDNPLIAGERRAAIRKVPGQGPVRGVWVFNGDVYAFRDKADGTSAGMYKATLGGWQEQSFSSMLEYSTGTTEFVVGEYVAGGTSTATGLINRVVLREGAWDGTGLGYLIVSNVVGTFVTGETLTSSGGGGAAVVALTAMTLNAGGRYDCVNHNFYGAAERARMYFANGVQTAFEWSGKVLAPVHTGQSESVGIGTTLLLATNGDEIHADPIPPDVVGDSIIMFATADSPAYVAHFMNHLFLGFTSGTILNSAIGEPLEFNTTGGAGEIAFGEQITGLLPAAATSLMVLAQNRIEFITGTDSTTFVMQPITDASGAQPYTAQMMQEPIFLDDGGLRSLSTTAAFGDWRVGTMTQAIERLMRQKRDNTAILPSASMRIRAKDQYKLFWDDGTGITTYIGRKAPETIPFKLPIRVYTACAGEVTAGRGDRLFVACYDGYVYEMSVGTSFDGEPIESYIRLPFTSAGSPSQETRWTKATFEIDSPDDITIGVAFAVDYAKGLGGSQTNVDLDAGTQIITSDNYDEVDWTQPVEGRLEYHLSGIGPNIAVTLVHSSAVARPHTISAQTYNFSRRRLKR